MRFIGLFLLFHLFFGCAPHSEPPKTFNVIDITDIKITEDTIYPYHSCQIISGTVATLEFSLTNNLKSPIYTWVYDTNFLLIQFAHSLIVVDDLKKERLSNTFEHCGNIRCQIYPDSLLPGIPKTFKIEINDFAKKERLDHTKKFIISSCTIYMKTDSALIDTLYDDFTLYRREKGSFEFSPHFEIDFPKNIMRVPNKEYCEEVVWKYNVNTAMRMYELK